MAKAPSGNPPAIPLAMVRKSASAPAALVANSGPVRQKPVWTSSTTSSEPLARQSRDSSRR